MEIGGSVNRYAAWESRRYRRRVEARLGHPVIAAVPLLRPWFLRLNVVWMIVVNVVWLLDRLQPDPRFDGWIGNGFLAALGIPIYVLMFVTKPWSALVAASDTLEHRPTTQYRTSRLKTSLLRSWSPASVGIGYERRYWWFFQVSIDGRDYLVTYSYWRDLSAIEDRFACIPQEPPD